MVVGAGAALACGVDAAGWGVVNLIKRSIADSRASTWANRSSEFMLISPGY
jgi:hypothetical protein